MANLARPWTRFYHPLTAHDVVAPRWPHVPAAVREAATTYAERPAFTLALPNGSQGGLTYAEVDRLSDQFAVYLREVAGFKAGDRIALQMPNCLAYPVAVFGTLKAGLVMVNTNPLYTVPEMVHQFADSGAVGLIAIDVFAPKVHEALGKTSIKTVVVVSVSDLLPTMRRLLVRVVQKYVKKTVPPITFEHTTFATAVSQGEERIRSGADPLVYASSLNPSSIAALQYTGGTTGVAKGAVLTHGNLVCNVMQSVEMWKPLLRFGEEVILTALPLYHIFAFTANLMVFFVTGRTECPGAESAAALEPQSPDDARTRDLVHRASTRCSRVSCTSHGSSSIRLETRGTIAGGMALVPVIGDRWEEMTKTPIFQGYGLTETSPVATLNPFHRPKRASIGVPLPGTDVRLVDDTGHDAPYGEAGELWIKGPQVMEAIGSGPMRRAARCATAGWPAAISQRSMKTAMCSSSIGKRT
jgi:long-chain acyl-CoA synthetase